MSIIADYAAYYTSVLRTKGYLLLPQDQTITLRSPILVPSGAVIEGRGRGSVLSCDGDWSAIKMVERDGTKPSHTRLFNFRVTRTNTAGTPVAVQDDSYGIWVWGDDVEMEALWLDEHYRAISFIEDAASSSTDVRMRGIRVSHSNPIANASQYGVRLSYVDGVKLEDWKSEDALTADLSFGTSVTSFGSRLSVASWGARGGGVIDAAGPIQKALTTLQSAAIPMDLDFPDSVYALATTLTYVGRGEALSLHGRHGGTVAWGGTQLKYTGAATNNPLLDIKGVWRGVVEHIDFNANGLARSCVWYHSDQASGGAGAQGYVFKHCGFLDVNPDAADPVVFRVGEAVLVSGSTQQVDLTRWEHCQFRGSVTRPQDVTLWRQEQGGNTCEFSFESGAFYYGRYGIDAAQGSGVISVTDTYFAEIGDAGNGTDAACMRFSGAVRADVRSVATQNSLKARFISSGSMGASQANGLTVTSCQPTMTLPDDKGAIQYSGPLHIKETSFTPAVADGTFLARVIHAPLRIGIDGAGGQPPGSLISEGNCYGYGAANSYPPFYDGNGTPNPVLANPLTGPDSYGASGYYGYHRCPVYSRGDAVIKTGTTVQIALEPWDGSVAHDTVAWTPGAIADGASVRVTRTWGIAGTLSQCDDIRASFSSYLAAGLTLTCGKSGAEAVWAEITNRSGGSVTPSAGTVTFSARRGI